MLQLRHLRLEWVFRPVCVLCCLSVTPISALDGYFLTDQHSPGGPADSASSHSLFLVLSFTGSVCSADFPIKTALAAHETHSKKHVRGVKRCVASAMVCGNQCCNCGAILARRVCLRTHLKDSVRRGFCRASVAKGSPTQRIVEFSPMSCTLCGAQLSENDTALAHMAAHLRTFRPRGDLVRSIISFYMCVALSLCTLLFSSNTFLIDSRRVLCWRAGREPSQRHGLSGLHKVRRNSNAPATGSKDDLERQLLSTCARPTKCAGCLAPQKHLPLNRESSEGPRRVRRCDRGSESTRNSHKGKNLDMEESPDEYAFVGTCWALHQNLQDATGQNAIKDFLDAHPPQRQEIGSRSPLLSSARSLGRKHVKFYLRTRLRRAS